MKIVNATCPEDVREILRDALEASGGTQVELAQHMGFSAKHMSFMLSGRAGLSIPHLFAMLDYLGLGLVMSHGSIVQAPAE